MINILIDNASIFTKHTIANIIRYIIYKYIHTQAVPKVPAQTLKVGWEKNPRQNVLYKFISKWASNQPLIGKINQSGGSFTKNE